MPPPPRLSNIFQKTYQNWLLPLFLHEIEALWLLSQTVRIRFHPDSERELCVNSGARQKQRVREFELDFLVLQVFKWVEVRLSRTQRRGTRTRARKRLNRFKSITFSGNL